MASLPVRSARLEANPVSPRRQHRIPGDTRNPPARRVDKVPLLFDTAKQKNLSKSVTEFFSKLRPSKRPERGNTIRPPPDSYEERQSAEPRSPKPTASCRAERSSSLGRYGPDTIPASRWNTPVTPPRRAQTTTLTPSTRDLFLAKRALRRQRHTLISSGDFLGVTGANPYTGEPDLITPPTSSDDAVVTSSSSPTTATATGTGTGAGMGADMPEWELGNLRVTPIDLHRLADDCRGRRIPTSRVLELDDLRAAESWGSSQLCNLDSLRDPTDMIPKACSMGVSHGLGQAFQSVCTRTITTTGFGHSRPRHRAVAHLFDGTLGGSHEAPRSRRVLMPRALSQSTSPPLSTGMSENVYSNRLASPGQMQLSVWFNPNSPGPRTATSTLDQKKVGIDPLKGSPIPHPLRKPGADSDTTSPSTGQGRTAPGPEKHSAKPNPIAAETENRPAQREQPDWEMRKTMRSPSGNGSPQDETDTHRSSHTSTRTSTSPTSPTTPAQPPSPGTARAPWLNQAAAETIARGAARTAFAHHQGGSGWAQQTRVPVSAPDPGPQPPHRARARVQAAGTRAKPAAKPGAGAETGSGQGSGQGKGTGKGKSEGRGGNEKNGKEMGKDKDKEKEKDKEKDKEKGKGKANTADPNKIEAKRWARSAMLMLVKVVGAYWQVVSPVFDGDSQLRKRIDKAQATRGDAVVIV
ncbi:predicted protein [Chaetomium globosum CBS 148.51]|uniref:Uncharacterized protein n=1 Tax=Chaetomium globosum (strain ATCC 6205 / CBS 148.51 / DSM 1962 / NBRC 6347 / NRRL 1970) TaxID=306901 RepID=Q2H014_CHAGB|nr:uncharacterized protein CHGG_04882 [Chaetomium globosum CBS 148.51]EAQ88263.1 predicted protein [Chaetomium globosum CBS 148.51]